MQVSSDALLSSQYDMKIGYVNWNYPYYVTGVIEIMIEIFKIKITHGF